MMSRLGEIKNSHLRGIHSLFGTPWVSMPKDNFEWLIQQAERVQELEEDKNALSDLIEETAKIAWNIEQQNKHYREALEEIVHQENLKETNVFGYDHEDISSYVEEVARKALEESE